MSQKCIKMHNTLYKSLCISTSQLIADFSSMEMCEEDRAVGVLQMPANGLT